MTTLSIRLKKGPDADFHRLVVNEIEDEESYAVKGKNGLLFATIHDERVWKMLLALHVRDISKHFGSVKNYYQGEWDGWDKVDIQFWSYHGKKKNILEFHLQPDTERWAKPYSLVEYTEAFEEAIKKLSLPGTRYYEYDELISNGFGIRCRISAGNPVVSDEVERCAAMLMRIREKATELLSDSARRNSITTFFSFPSPVKAACEQYLLYFVQFLEDLGIKAGIELKEDARRVLFSVSPADGNSALKRVREALDIYLRLPGTPNFGTQAGQYPDLAVQQLHANVLHFQAQLALAKASIQAQQATIEALQLSNYQYRQMISSEQKIKTDKEPIIGDTVHVTKVEAKGLSIDLPTIFRRMKRVFGIGKDIDV